jgi:hypothetical protein
MNSTPEGPTDAPPVDAAKEATVEYGTDDSTKQPLRSSVGMWRPWKIAAFVGVLSLLVFVIVFPTLMVRRGGSSTKSSFATSTTNPTSADTSKNVTVSADTSKNVTVDYKREVVIMEGPINATLEVLGNDTVHGYKNDEDFQNDLGQAANLFVGNTILTNVENFGTTNGVAGGGTASSGATPESDSGAATFNSAAASPQKVSDGTNDFGTNNQEKGVEEGDMIVSDGVNGTWHRFSMKLYCINLYPSLMHFAFFPQSMLLLAITSSFGMRFPVISSRRSPCQPLKK